MGTRSFRILQLLDPTALLARVAPVHHRSHADFSINIQLIASHSESNISAYFRGIRANYHTTPVR